MESNQNKIFLKRPDPDENALRNPDDEVVGQRLVVEGLTPRECIYQLAIKAYPTILNELKLQKFRKKQSFHMAIDMHRHGYRIQCRIAAEVKDRIIHHEIFARNLPVKQIGVPTLESFLKDSAVEVVDEMENICNAMLKDIKDGKSASDPSMLIAGSRRIALYQNTNHIIQMAAVMYPAVMPRIEDILTHFFRSQPVGDPSKN